MSIPVAAKEMLLWVRRTLRALDIEYEGRDLSSESGGFVTIADIILYQFMEFTHDCYGLDLTIGTGAMTVDPYGREVKDEYPNLVRLYQAFRNRESAKRVEERGEFPGAEAKAAMCRWADGV